MHTFSFPLFTDSGRFVVCSFDSIVSIFAITEPGASTAGQKSGNSIQFVSSTSDMPRHYKTHTQCKTSSLVLSSVHLLMRAPPAFMDPISIRISQSKTGAMQPVSMALHLLCQISIFPPWNLPLFLLLLPLTIMRLIFQTNLILRARRLCISNACCYRESSHLQLPSFVILFLVGDLSSVLVSHRQLHISFSGSFPILPDLESWHSPYYCEPFLEFDPRNLTVRYQPSLLHWFHLQILTSMMVCPPEFCTAPFVKSFTLWACFRTTFPTVIVLMPATSSLECALQALPF